MARVLIIDDSGFQRSVIRMMLQKDGHETIEAPTGGEGIAAARTKSPQVILLDLLMPDMTGIDVLKVLRAENITTPVVVVTADIQETSRKGCMNLGAVGFVNKPVKGDNLTHLLKLVKLYSA